LKFIAEEFFKGIKHIKEELKFSFMRTFMLALRNDKYIDSKGWTKTVYKACMTEINIYMENIKGCTDEGNFKSALSFISELTFAQEQVVRTADSRSDDRQVKEIKKQIEDITMVATGMQKLHLAQEALEGDNDVVDRAILALDHLTEAKYFTKDHDTNTFCKAKLLEGKIFLNYVENKMKAKTCFSDIVNNPNAKSKHTVEFSEAKFNLEKLEAEESQSKKPNVDKNALKDEIKNEMKQLENAANMSDESFMKFLFDTFPPKHKDNYKRLEINAANPKKKIFIRLSSYYHPDKVDTSIYSEAYKVLCEEILKRINARFAKMK
jgi:hypothetical protein